MTFILDCRLESARAFDIPLPDLGQMGERFVAKVLRSNYCNIWHVNWRCNKGELDICCHLRDTLHVIEVKTRHVRRSSVFPIIESISHIKEKRLEKLSEKYAKDNEKLVKKYRISHLQIDAAFVQCRDFGYLKLLSLDFNRNISSFSIS